MSNYTVCPVKADQLTGTLNACWHINGAEYKATEATYRPLNCGKEAFEAVYRAIEAAQHTIDIVCWGFQPSMYFIRDGKPTLTIGQLLEKKAKEGKKVKVLGWDMSVLGFSPVGVAGEANLPGRAGLENRNKTKRLDDLRAYSQNGKYTSTDAQYAYDQDWFRRYMDVDLSPRLRNDPIAKKRQEEQRNANLRFRGRGFDDSQRVEIAWRTRYFNLMSSSKTTQALHGLSVTHHQKSVLVDYTHPEIAVGFVMGHNTLDEYWDTEAHSCQPSAPDRGRNGGNPRQDISALVTGPVLSYLHANFAQGWQDATGENLAAEPARKAATARFEDKNIPKRQALLRPDKGEVTMAQLLRTHAPRHAFDIQKMYLTVLNNATRFIYVENQYFRWLPFADKVKDVAAKLTAAGADPGKHGSLNLFVVTNSSDEGMGPGILNTYKVLDSLGRPDTIPNVARSQEIEWRKQQLEQARQKARDEQKRSNSLQDELARSTAQLPGLTDYKNGLMQQVRQAQEAVKKATAEVANAQEALKASTIAKEAAEKSKKEQPIVPRAIPGLNIHVCALVAPDSPGYQPDMYVPAQSPREKSLGLKPNPAMNKYVPPELVKDTTWPEVYIHSKLMIIDDAFITNGSANLNMRSMQTDTELNIISPNGKVARDFRRRLWRQHTTGHFGKKKIWGAQDDPDEAFKEWGKLIQKNKDAQNKHLRPEASLVELFRGSPQVKDQD